MVSETQDGEKPKPAQLTKLISDPDTFTVLMLSSIIVMPLIAGAWLLALPLAISLCLVMATRKSRLPFRIPMMCKGLDYGAPIPGNSHKFRSGEGLLFLGNEFDTNEEIWISNSDARRHALVLATTGAGKALPDDTLVLTSNGWRQNGDLRVGDYVFHPSGRQLKILSIHPQGMLPMVQLLFADGRRIACSRDHLWRVKLLNDTGCSVPDRNGLWTAADIGITLQLNALQGEDRIRMFVELPQAMQGNSTVPSLSTETITLAANQGLQKLGFMPSLSSTPKHRISWLVKVLKIRGFTIPSDPDNSWIDVCCVNQHDGFLLRHMIWSLGGMALQLIRNNHVYVMFQMPNQQLMGEHVPPCSSILIENGLEITGVEGFLGAAESKQRKHVIRQFIQFGRLGASVASQILRKSSIGEKSMTCIRTEADDGMFVIEGYIPTHNTEFLLGLASQSLMWSSGFLYIDGKGTAEFHAKAWSIVSKFGRQDDYRVLNFTDGGVETDMSAGGPEVQSNTLNPFSQGSADQLMNLIVSLMGDSGSSGDMWRHRAMALVTSTMKALVEMRNAGDILLDVQTIRDFLPLGIGLNHKLVAGKNITAISEVSDELWDELYQRGGLIELYLRALKGDFSERSRLALKGFFDSLPGFSLEKALRGEPQEGRAAEQYGFLSMQLTKPLGSLADDFGHIFRTPVGEVDMDDVVLNRRVLIVLLPALQKAPEEMRNCGRIVVSMLKMMMGRAAGSKLVGEKHYLVDVRPTTAPSPFIAILDEAGYYMVKGIDTMMAQARSLGFMIVIAGQDMASMQSISPHIAETVAANARLTVAGATEDANRTWQFLRQKFARQRVAVASGKISKLGLFSTKWVNRPDQQFVETDRVKIRDLQQLREGEFFFLMESKIVKARAFYIEDCWTPWLAINKMLAIRGPYDPELKGNKSRGREFLDAVEIIGSRLMDEKALELHQNYYPFDPHDGLHCSVRYAEKVLDSEDRQKNINCNSVNDAGFLGLMLGSKLRVSE